MTAARLLSLCLLSAACAFARSTDCAPCHRSLYESYRKTPMAQSAGATPAELPGGQFTKAGFAYRVTAGRLEVAGASKSLAYFVGSGATARSFLLAAEGFLFEAPVAYYTQPGKWDLAPGYDRYAYPYLTRPAPPGCLTCHASFLRPAPGTQNGYQNPPFEEGGVACERCHVKGNGHFVNPAKLAADARDQVCAQCHLSGEARVPRPGRDPLTFVRAGSTGMQVTSHVENLEQSRCRQSSEVRLWCGTCHDPHTLPDPAQIRQRCADCHTPAACKDPRGATGDCLACHMPKSAVTDAQHVVYTDHSLPRRPRKPASPNRNADLVPFRGGGATDRDLGLAYAIANQPERAVKLLESAERTAPNDPEVLVYLAEIYRNRSQEDRAAPLYERALRQDPSQLQALVGLGAIRLAQGRTGEATRLWSDALSRNPGLDLTRTNLAMAQWRNGDREAALATLRKGIELSPGFRPAKDLLERLRAPR